MFSIVGVFIVSYTSEFLLFMLKTIPVLIGMSLPLFNYFNLTSIDAFYLLPVQGCLNLVVNSYNPTPVVSELVYGYVSLGIWMPLLYIISYRTFKARIVNT